MQTNFFSLLHQLNFEGDIVITIKTGNHNRMIGTILLKNDKVGDPARKVIPTLNFGGTIQELEEGFFQGIKNPISKTIGIFTNIEQYEKGQEKAKLQSKMEQDKKEQQKKQHDSGNKKYEAQMKKVAELEEVGKYREAYGQLPKVDEYPGQEEVINEKKQELTEKFDQPSLF